MVISSLVVETLPESTERAAAELRGRAGVTVHHVIGRKIVVTVEAETLDASSEIAGALGSIDGVCTVGLAYVNFEDDPSLIRAGA